MLLQIAWTVSVAMKRGQSLRKGRKIWANFKFIGAQSIRRKPKPLSILSFPSSPPKSPLSALIFNTFWAATLVFSLLKVVLYSFAGLQWLSSEVNWDLKTEFYDAPRSNIVPSWPQGNTMHCSQSIALFNFEYCMGSIAVLHGQCIKQPEVVVRPLISSPPLHSTAPSPLSLIPNLHCKDCSRLQLRIALRKKVHHIHSSKLNWVVSDLISLHISICLALFVSMCPVKKCNHLVLRAVGPEKLGSRVFLTTSVLGIMYIWGSTVNVHGPNNPNQMESWAQGPNCLRTQWPIS